MTSFDLEDRRSSEPRRQDDRQDKDSVRLQWTMVWQIIGYAVGLFVVYNALTNRQTANETELAALKYSVQQDRQEIKADINEMKSDIKMLLSRTAK